MRRASGGSVLLALVVQLFAAAPGAVPVARAAEFSMETEAAYEVRPSQGFVAVSVDVTFENTTPDPPGQFSLFSEVKLAIHDQAEDVSASDGDGDLEVAVGREGDVNVATVRLRDGLRHEEVATFTLEYRLPDGDDPEQRVRQSLVVFNAWGFGTSSEVRVSVPSGYEVQVDGDPLQAELSANGTLLRSGQIETPERWLAVVTAVRPGSFATVSATVPLAGGTADLHVRAFDDDEAWGEQTLVLLAQALPLLEEEIGLPYSHVGPLVVSESVGAGDDAFTEQAEGAEILIAFDQPGFTVLHQIAHLWLDAELIPPRWVREGIASQVAEQVGSKLGLDPPYDPAEELEVRADAAVPLDSWASSAGAEEDRYAYAASWALMREIVDQVAEEGLREVLQQAAAGIGPYELGRADPSADRTGPLPLDSRALLDRIEPLAAPTSLTDRFADIVFDADDVALLERRAAAREDLDALLREAGEWGSPDGVREAMRGWSFADAIEQIRAAREWIAGRDVLLDEMQRIGLSAPTRLRDAYVVGGGGPEAQTELTAEAAVVEAYGAALDRVNAQRSLLVRLGLVGGPDPAAQLTVANGLFAEGDLRAAADAIEEAERQLASAETTGILRLASVGVAVALVMVAIFLLVRRRRRPAART